jgi:hypothetical protein
VNWSAVTAGLVPTGVVTVILTIPALPDGEVAVMLVELITVTFVAAVAPNFTAVAPVKLVPVIVTLVPPAVPPMLGLTAVTAGAPSYVNWSCVTTALVPFAVVTVILTVPALPAGAVAVMLVVFVTEKLVAETAPNFTAVAPVKFVPPIVTWVPPVSGPLLGLTAVTVGTV